jgi:ABC-2 type transport system ATP-binding protein
MKNAIEIRGLRKSYGDVDAVRGVDLTVAAGEVFALLGPNGAGKTTIVEILEGYRKRDAGDASVLGFDPGTAGPDFKARIGIVLQSTGIDPYLTVAETVALYSGYYPHPRPVDEVVELVGLAEKHDERVLRLSGGQQRRLDVAIALAGDPELLFLDEPTTGFDPSARRGAWEIVKSLAALGKTVLLTTHYMDEAQYLADRVAVIAGGKFVAEGSPATLAGRDAEDTWIRFRLPAGAEPPPQVASQQPEAGGYLAVATEDPTGDLHALTGWALDHGYRLEALEVLRPSLEDVYLELTGAPGDDARTEHAASSGRQRRRRR